MYSYQPVRLAAWYYLGRAQGCPLENSLQAPAEIASQIATKDRILYASKKLQTDEKGFELWQTPHGEYWIPKGSHFVLPFNLAEQARNIYTPGDVHVKSGDVVLDCGANIGVYTRKALDAGAAKVIAIEPAPENLECLRRNFKSEIEAGKVVVYPKGVWDKDDMLTLHVDPHNSAADSFLIEREGHTDERKIPLTTIDKLVAELKLDRVDFIKMDIEGAEVRALHGARAAIAKNHPRMALSTYHAPDHPVEVPKAVRAAWDGYRSACGVCAELPFGLRPDIMFFY
jgi:FkbM family methyltransferase